MGIVVLGAVFVDIKGYPSDLYIPGSCNANNIWTGRHAAQMAAARFRADAQE